jgi:hypothetical protein
VTDIDLEVLEAVSFTINNPVAFDPVSTDNVLYEVTDSSGFPMTAPDGSGITVTANDDHTKLTISFEAQNLPINTVIDYYLTAQIDGCFENPLTSAHVYRVTWNRCDYDLKTLAVNPSSFKPFMQTSREENQEPTLPVLFDKTTNQDIFCLAVDYSLTKPGGNIDDFLSITSESLLLSAMGGNYDTILPEKSTYTFVMTSSDITDWEGATL